MNFATSEPVLSPMFVAEFKYWIRLISYEVNGTVLPVNVATEPIKQIHNYAEPKKIQKIAGKRGREKRPKKRCT